MQVQNANDSENEYFQFLSLLHAVTVSNMIFYFFSDELAGMTTLPFSARHSSLDFSRPVISTFLSGYLGLLKTRILKKGLGRVVN